VAGAAVLGKLTWQVGQLVEAVAETPGVKSLTIDLPEWRGQRAGQHVDIRLTAEDGYQTVRSYSLASPPEERRVVVTIERLDDGEVSPYLVDEVRATDQLEVRGPIGGYFVWEISRGGPLFLIAGSSGIVPLMAMIRHRLAGGSDVQISLLYSTRSPEDVIYRTELDGLTSQRGIEVVHTFRDPSHPVGRATVGGSTPRCWRRSLPRWTSTHSPLSAAQPHWWKEQRLGWWRWGTSGCESGQSALDQQGGRDGCRGAAIGRECGSGAAE
jgi:ferredoxin-NADP reductase